MNDSFLAAIMASDPTSFGRPNRLLVISPAAAPITASTAIGVENLQLTLGLRVDAASLPDTPDENAKVFTADGFLKTGDVAASVGCALSRVRTRMPAQERKTAPRQLDILRAIHFGACSTAKTQAKRRTMAAKSSTKKVTSNE